MSSDATKKLQSAYRIQMLIRTIRNSIFLLLCMGLFAFVYFEMSNEVVPDHMVADLRRFENFSKFKNDFAAVNGPDWDCDGPCLPNPDAPFVGQRNHLEKLVEDVLPILTPFGKEVLTSDITNLKIYIYNLPLKFSSDIAQCAVSSRSNSMCFDFANNGFGPEIQKLKVDVPNGMRFYKTHQFSLEVIIHQKLLRSPYLTNDPYKADLFYVPFYAGLSCFCGEELATKASTEFWNFAKNLTYFHTGKIHFMALSKVEQEMSSMHCPFLRDSHTDVLKYLIIEQTLSEKTRKYFLRYGKEDETVVVPYPSYAHFDRPDVAIPCGDNRTISVMMAGSMKNGNLRKILSDQLDRCDSCKFYKMNPEECSNYAENVGKRVISIMAKSTFCLNPPGDTPTRKSFYDSIMTGCIPVYFIKGVMYPFNDLFKYDEFSVYVDEDILLKDNTTLITKDILEKIPQVKVLKLQKNLASVARFFQYGAYGFGDDALTTTLRLLLYISS